MLTELSLTASAVLFAAATGVIVLAGTRLTSRADRLADRTGLGEAITGAVFLGACTSLPGITASVTAAFDGRPALSLSNAVGGIAAQTAFLAIADIAYRKANLEHAAASLLNMMQSALLVAMLAVLLLGMFSPAVTFLGIHPVTPVLFVAYALGLKLIRSAQGQPTWKPTMTAETAIDQPDEPEGGGQVRRLLLVQFFVAAALVVVAGWVLTRSAESLADRTGLDDTLVGGVFTAVCTSLPELVTSVAAVRRGALTLAVGGIIGGNAFDTLFAAMADIAYRPGSIYHAAREAGGGQEMLIVLTIVMTAVLLLGLLRRERQGMANIGFESVMVLGLYLGGVALLTVM
jgi:cation:H+ antiporter